MVLLQPQGDGSFVLI